MSNEETGQKSGQIALSTPAPPVSMWTDVYTSREQLELSTRLPTTTVSSTTIVNELQQTTESILNEDQTTGMDNTLHSRVKVMTSNKDMPSFFIFGIK